jgi:hypothetical protein
LFCELLILFDLNIPCQLNKNNTKGCILLI